MTLEKIFHKGQTGRPLVIFIHGMGMDMRVWTDPSDAAILGGKYPLSVLLRDLDTDMKSSFIDLKELGFPVLAWSQKRPVASINISVKELHDVIKSHAGCAADGIVLICHSRGGLIARKYLEEANSLIRMMITLATPHNGTSIARWGVYISPLASLLKQFMGVSQKADVDSAFRRILSFLSSDGLRELLPDSPFYSGLKDKKQKGTYYISLCGTDSNLLRINALSISDLLQKIAGNRILPVEMRDGFGDGLVSAASAVLPFADEHLSFPVNHASILFDRSVRNYIVKVLKTPEGRK